MAYNAKSKESTYNIQRRKVEKLMENPDKLVELPDSDKTVKKVHEPPDFVRNVMGSSAGAGSGEFHVYRYLRRKEIGRRKEMEESAKKEELDIKFRNELEHKKRMAEERTLKKKQKRDKKKAKQKQKRKGDKDLNIEPVSDETSNC